MPSQLAKRPSTRQLYSPPGPDPSAPYGYEDFPFTWAYDGTPLADGIDILNQYVYILGGWGDFIMRRCVGLSTVINPVGGSFQLYDSQNRPLSSGPIVLGAVNDDLMFPNEVPFKETTKISFDLFNTLRDPALPSVQIAVGREPVLRGAGPYNIGGALYTVLTDLVSNLAEIWQSLDGGATWIEIDSAGSPSVDPSGGWSSACTDGLGNIYLVCADPFGTFLFVYVFNTTTLLWDAGTAAGGTVDLPSPNSAVVYRPSDGKLVICSNSIPFSGAAGAQRTSYTIYDPVAHTYTVSAACGAVGAGDPQDWFLINVVRGIGMTHFIFGAYDTGTLANLEVRQQPLTDGGVLGSIQTVDSNPGNVGDDAVLNYFAAVSDGTTVVIGFVPNTTLGVPAIVYQGTSAAVIAFTSQNVTIPPIAVTGVGVARTAGRTAFFFAVDDTVNTSWFWTFDAGGGFSVVISGGTTNDTAFGSEGIPAPVGLFAPGFTFMFFAGVGTGTATYILATAVKVLSSQIAFQGVRRLKRLSPPIDDSCDYDERTFTYGGGPGQNSPNPLQGVISDVGPTTGGASLVLVQTINDYDFDLYQVIIAYQAAGILPEVVAAVQIFDYAKNRISNIPLLDIFVNGAPGSKYANGAMVPPLKYKQNTQIRVEFYSLTSVVPVTVTLMLVGKQRYPKVRMAS